MRGAAPCRLLYFVTLRGTLRDFSGEVGAVNHPILTQTLLVHIEGLLGIVARFTSVPDNLHYPTNVTCHNPHPISSLTLEHSFQCFVPVAVTQKATLLLSSAYSMSLVRLEPG